MRTLSFLVASILVTMALIGHGATRKVDFSEDPVGQAPKGFEFGHTAKVGARQMGGAGRRQQQVPCPD
jgi:hypothetical protein